MKIDSSGPTLRAPHGLLEKKGFDPEPDLPGAALRPGHTSERD